MVSQQRPGPRRGRHQPATAAPRPDGAGSDTRDRILAAAEAEFAARGFDGATVDRIAARARVNKAMLYYHFRSKAGLYRHILHGLFSTVAARVQEVPDTLPADEQLRRFIDALHGTALAHMHFPAIWLRELADVGEHLDPPTVQAIARILERLARILVAGRAAGQFAPAHPLAVQLGIVGPLLIFAASAPARARLGAQIPAALDLTREALANHVKTVTLAGLAVGAAAVPASGRRFAR